jgi:hypothetical protein
MHREEVSTKDRHGEHQLVPAASVSPMAHLHSLDEQLLQDQVGIELGECSSALSAASDEDERECRRKDNGAEAEAPAVDRDENAPMLGRASA